MHRGFLAAAIGSIIFINGCHSRPPTAAPGPPASIATGTNNSGVYGISGARVAGGESEGVVGECVWIYDADDAHQVAKGECREGDPGKFRIALKPGRYVLHGPGGIKRIEVQPGTWVKVMSLVDLPMSP